MLHSLLDETQNAARGESGVLATLASDGWSRVELRSLTVGGDIRVGWFMSPSCPQGIGIAVLPLSADLFHLVADMVPPGDQLFFVVAGRSVDKPPSSLTLLRAKLGAIAAAADLAAPATPLLAIAAPASCHAKRTISWSAI